MKTNKTRSSREIVARNLKLALSMIDTGNEEIAYTLIIKTGLILQKEFTLKEDPMTISSGESMSFIPDIGVGFISLTERDYRDIELHFHKCLKCGYTTNKSQYSYFQERDREIDEHLKIHKEKP